MEILNNIGFSIASLALFVVFAIGPFALAVWVGAKIAEQSWTWLGWVVGIAIFFVCASVSNTVNDALPTKMQFLSDDDCYEEYDGRSRQTVCD